jgi:[glutamine synthetase] adenylyltransferase / [glutamine synthetase]-adenylyl-L-tyrosine phosphorylase
MTTFANRIVKAPKPHERESAAAIRDRFRDCSEPVRDLLAGAAGCSGYLAMLINHEADWLRDILAGPPEQAFDELLGDITAEDPGSLATSLRRAKRRGGLLIALADLGGVWDLETVTGTLTRLADIAVQNAIRTLVAAEIARGKIPGCREEDAEDGAGLFALAMGKMGAGELNYSSDIDLVLLFDETRHDPDDYAEVRRSFIRVAQKMVKLLSERTGDGYVFRTDLRLRPDPSSTPLVLAAETAEQYYESLGRTWERAAYIKARPCAGDFRGAEAFLANLRPFIWRRHLDFAAIEDAYGMLARIRSHKGLAGPIDVPGHNLKLGRGGIREIEFFTQTRQLILGGRNPQLRDRRTLPAIAALVAGGWAQPELANSLTEAYRTLRTIEHRLQMIEDAQTHRLPATDEGLALLANFCSAESPDAFRREIRTLFETVHALTEPFFAPESPSGDPAPSPWQVFAEPAKASEIMSSWRRLPALRSERGRAIFKRLEPELLRRMSKAHDADEALRSLDAFLSRLPAGIQVFSLMEANPPLLDLLVDICGTTPSLARYLGDHAGVLDAVISPDFFKPLRGAKALTESLGAALSAADDYETALNRARIWMKERHFRIGVHLLRGLAEPVETSAAYSAVAEAVVDAVLPLVEAEFARRHGAAPGTGAAVLAMGKLGSREMTATSDLDLMVIYEAEDDASSDGRRPLAAKAYYARLTQALISALTAPMPEGILYAVDMRLRPSGRQGPLATGLSSFRNYQTTDAWTWEHMALTRARTVAGPPGLRADIEESIACVLKMPRDPLKILADARDMRRRLAEALEKDRTAASPWACKKGAGRMMDIEVLAQTGALLHAMTGLRRPRRMLESLRKADWLTAAEAETLTAALDRLSAFQQVSRLASERTSDPRLRGEGFVRLVLTVTGARDIDGLKDLLVSEARICDEIISRRLEAL